MKINDLLLYVKKFDTYTDSFLKRKSQKDYIENVNLKIIHSKNVYNHALNIAKYENCNEKDTFIAGICGLYHDIGRFVQFYEYNTFKDSDSLYHGELGCNVIDKENFFSELNSETINLIKKAVFAHGLINIPENYNDREQFFSKITRDSDKADIFRIVAKYYNHQGPRNIALEYGLSNNPKVSEDVLNLFLDNKMISKDKLKTLNDFKLMQIAWINDIYFRYTINYINENSFIEIILNSINDEYSKNIIKNHLKNKKAS